MNIKQKNVLVYGLSSSGEWAAKLLKKHKANVFLYDDDENVLNSKKIKNCYILNELNFNYIEQFDFLVVSPSIAEDNKFLQYAKQVGIKIYSELEFSALYAKKLVAVTGTNGKTTTVKLITALLQTKYKAVACGNIGYPLSRAILETKKSIKVAEVSSFMLENAETFSPKVSTILNIESDHLIRHKTKNRYEELKKSIFKNVSHQDYVVVNLDRPYKPEKNCLLVTYSYSKVADVYVRNGAIYLQDQKIININQLNLKGKHNIYNIMCAICYAYVYKVKIKDIKSVLLNIQPEKHRIEKLCVVNNITFINDSKSTNIASTLAAIDSTKGAIILLLGGANKGLNYNSLFTKMSKRVKHICVFGEIANQLLLANNGFSMSKFDNLKQAFDFSLTIANPNDSIVLSPATSSYD